MGKEIEITAEYDYFYGKETLQFSFYRIPKHLVMSPEFQGLSVDAKLLYGILLDRSCLSSINGWVDSLHRVYIHFTIKAIETALGVSEKTAIKRLKELEAFGLITKQRSGQGRPTRIYVKNCFASCLRPEQNSYSSRTVKFTGQEPNILQVKNCNNDSPETYDLTVQDTEFLQINNTDLNIKEYNDTDPSFQDDQEGMIEESMVRIKNNICYRKDLYSDPDRQALFDEIYDLICDIVCIRRGTVRVNRENYPYSIVRERFLRIRLAHVEYVMETFAKAKTKITNIRAYLISSLYNSVLTMEHYYQSESSADNF